jgi:DNA-binding response OmpR family regulator
LPRVLIVEDEVIVGISLAEELRDVGFEVAVHHDAESAKQWLEDAQIDAAIIDVGLPGASGDAFARECRLRFPHIPIVLATAMTESELPSHLLKDSNLSLMVKPFQTRVLIDMLKPLERQSG